MDLFFKIFVITIVIALFAGMWKTFEKAGESGWKSLIPIYNWVVLFRIAGLNPFLLLLLLVPIVGAFMMFYMWYHLALSFGRGVGFTIGLTFLTVVFLPILGFGDDQYRKPTQ
jgi:hypothetical protein